MTDRTRGRTDKKSIRKEKGRKTVENCKQTRERGEMGGWRNGLDVFFVSPLPDYFSDRHPHRTPQSPRTGRRRHTGTRSVK